MNYDPYAIRFKPHERQMLKEVARRIERSQQDTVRVLIRGAFQYLREQEEKGSTNKNVGKG
jgi:hypothetical protein